MNRTQLGRRVATVTVGTALSVAAVGGSAWAAPGQPDAVGATSPAHQIYTTAQPASTADFSGHGANVSGPYDSTRHGAASANGNGGGGAVGRPCAGCVGKADNKNPKGQLPGGSDGNAGYECDRNKGIAQGNPAHTSCTTNTAAPVVTAPTVAVAAPPKQDVAAAVVSGASATRTPAPTVEAISVVRGSGSVPALPAVATPRARVLGLSVTRASEASRTVASAALPFTGAPIRGLLLVALLVLTAGIALTAGFRRPAVARLPRAVAATA